MEIEVLFAKIAVKNRACTREQVEEALERLSAGTIKAGALPDALIELGHLNSETARKILDFIEGYTSGRVPAGPAEAASPASAQQSGVAAPAASAQVPPPPAASAPASDTVVPDLAFSCVECGKEIPTEQVRAGSALVLFGEAYCQDCLSDALKLVRLQEARHSRSSRKLRAVEPSQTPPDTAPATAAPDAEPLQELDPFEPGEIALPADVIAERRKNVKQKQAPEHPQVPPPALPKVSSVEEMQEEEIKEIEKLVSKGREDLAVARLSRSLNCSAKDAQAALDRLKADFLAPVQGSKGILGFARNVRRSTSFSLNVWRKNWARVVEDGEAWLSEEPENADLLLAVGTAYREMGRTDRAEKTLRRAVAASGATIDATRQLALVLSSAGKHDEALEKYAAVAGSGSAAADDLRCMVAAAKSAGVEEKSLAPLETLISGNPQDALELREQQMGILYRAGRFEDCLKNLTAFLKAEKKPWDRGLFWTRKLAPEMPGDPLLWRQLSRIHERRGEGERAISAAREAIAVSPSDSKSLERLAELYVLSGDLGAALKTFESLFAAVPQDEAAQKKLAAMYRTAGMTEEAVRVYSRFAGTGALDTLETVDYANALESLGRVPEAADVLAHRAQEHGEAAEMLVQIRASLIDRRIDGALETLAGASAELNARIELAAAFIERGLPHLAVSQAIFASATAQEPQAGEVESILEKAFETGPGDRRLAFFLARRYAARSEAAKAAASLRKFLGRRPHDFEAKKLLLDILVSGRMFKEAVALASELSLLGDVFAAGVESALVAVSSAAQDDPDVALAHARFLDRLGRREEAAAKYIAFAALTPARSAEIARDIIRLTRVADDARQMPKWLAAALEADPGDFLARLELVRSLLDSGDLEQGEAHIRKILESDPDNRGALVLLGKIEARKREAEIGELEKKLAAEPENVALAIDLGKALIAAGRKEDGLKLLHKSRSDPQVGWKSLEALYSTYRGDGDHQRALACLKELMPRRKPSRESREWKEIMYRMGDMYLSLSDPVRAGRVFFDIFKAEPGFRDVKSMMELVEIMEELVGTAASAAPSWFTGIGGRIEGPLTIIAVREWIDGGKLSADDLVWQAGFSSWKRALDADKIGLLFKYRDRLKSLSKEPVQSE